MFSWFEKRIDPFPGGENKVPEGGLIKFCFYYAKDIWKWLLFMSICTAIIAVIEVSLFGSLGNIVNLLASSGKYNFFYNNAVYLLLFAGLVLVVLPSVVAIQNMLIHQTLLGNFPMRVRWSMHRYLLGQSINFFHKQSSGKLCAKVMQTSLAVRETVMKIFDVFNYVLVYFAGTLFLAAKANWMLMMAFIVWLCAYIGMLVFFIPKLRKASQAQADANSVMTGRIVDAYTNISTVKLFSYNSREEAYAKDGMARYQGGVNKQMRLISLFSMGIYFLNCVLLFSVATMGLLLWQKNIVNIGAVAVGTGLALRLNGMAQWIMWEMSALFENIGIVEDGMRSLTIKRDVEDKPYVKPIDVKKAEIEFKNVSFCYNKSKTDYLFNNFNLKILSGQKVGIIGRSGSGKSTLVNLLLRFYDVDKGGIYIDDQNIQDVTQESLRQHIAVVSQDTALLHRTIRENIAYGKPHSTEEEILEAIKRADAYDFIQNLEDSFGNKSLDVYVGERGARLSGGQRQRVAISRAMLKDSPIVILDEATSALDSYAESEIQNSLEQIIDGKTVLVIAHRLSTIAKMDRLLVMDKGKIIEDGTHHELLANNGLYAQLWNKQVGGHLVLDNVA